MGFLDFLGGAAPQQPPAGGMNQAVNGQVPQEMIAAQRPPADDAELQNRVIGWQAIQAKMQDPMVRRALLQFGAQMMQGQAPGQSLGGLIGESAVGAVDTYAQLQAEQAKSAQEVEKHRVDVGLRTAQTQQTQSETRRADELHSAEKEKAVAGAKLARMQAQRAEYDVQEQNAETPAERSKWKKRREMIEDRLRQAQAGESAERTKWIAPKANAEIAQSLGSMAEAASRTGLNLQSMEAGGKDQQKATAAGTKNLESVKQRYVKLFTDSKNQASVMNPQDPIMKQTFGEWLISIYPEVDKSIFNPADLASQTPRSGQAVNPATGNRIIPYQPR